MPTFPALRLLCLLGAPLLLGACSSATPGSATEDAAERPRAGLLTREEVAAVLRDALGGGPALTYSALAERLAPPLREKTQPVTDRKGASQADTLRTVIYYGLEVTFHEAASPPQSMLSRIALTDPRFASPEGLRVGHAEDHLRKTLGRPIRQESTLYFYEPTGAAPAVLVIILERRAISRIEWRFQYE